MKHIITNHSYRYGLVSSTLGTTIVCLTSAWLVSLAFAPVVATVATPTSSGHLYQLSPIPPGADWTS
jgi:hypothetical protein